MYARELVLRPYWWLHDVILRRGRYRKLTPLRTVWFGENENPFYLTEREYEVIKEGHPTLITKEVVMDYKDLPWAKTFGKRCRARLSWSDSPDYFGRCELRPHNTIHVDHALERGMVWVRWKTASYLTGAGEG